MKLNTVLMLNSRWTCVFIYLLCNYIFFYKVILNSMFYGAPILLQYRMEI